MQNRSPLNVVCALVFHKGRVLATRRDPRRSFPLLWEFPGGKLEAGESAEEALHRELEEELTLKVEITSALDLVEYDEKGHHIRLHPFVCHPALPHAPAPEDHIEIRWVTPSDALQLTWAPADIPLLQQLERLST